MTVLRAAPRKLAVGILAGGQGTRFGGVDKGWIERDGAAQIERVLAAVRRNAEVLASHGDDRIGRVLVSANRTLARYASLGVEVVTDRWPDYPGPMAGIASLACALGHGGCADMDTVGRAAGCTSNEQATAVGTDDASSATFPPASFLRPGKSGPLFPGMNASSSRRMLDASVRSNDKNEGVEPVPSDGWLMTLPVDAAHVPDDLVAHLLSNADGTDESGCATPPIVAADAERDQPLFALYAPTHLAALVVDFVTGERSIARWQSAQHARICRLPALRFGNLNIPSDLDSR